MTVEVLSYKHLDLATLLLVVKDKYPNVRDGIVIVFDEQGGMHTEYCCNDQELALASVRLAHLANTAK
jgi:hypothetical protein